MTKESQIGRDQEPKNFALESDDRFNSVVRWLARRSRRNAVEHQIKQQELAASCFEDDNSVDFQSIIRQPDATEGDDLRQKLKESAGKPKVILLLNGIVNPQDIVQVSPFVERWGMKVLRLQQRFREKVSRTCDDIELRDSIPHYIVRTSRVIQNKLLDGANCDVIVVRNASKQDLFDVVQYGGENTVLVVSGHGTLGSLSMTDGRIENKNIPKPDKPLKAFVQHTCAKPDGRDQQMGEQWAKATYGWKRGTSPVDFLDNPLVFRNF